MFIIALIAKRNLDRFSRFAKITSQGRWISRDMPFPLKTADLASSDIWPTTNMGRKLGVVTMFFFRRSWVLT